MATEQVAPVPQEMRKNPYDAVGSNSGQWLLRRPASSDTRLILNFYADSWCGSAAVIDEELASNIPPQLAAKGITQEEWVTWITRFKETVNKHNLSCGCCFTLAFLTVTAPIVCCILGKHHNDIEKFNEDINRELFEPRGMFWTTQGSNITIKTGDDTSYSEDVQWIAISLTPEDAAQLKEDGHVFSFWCGAHEKCGCCACFCKFFCCCCQDPQY